jgi:hypothetical protein
MNQFYRNNKDITSIEGIEVDNGSLWKLDPEQNLLILEDEDQYATALLDENFDLAI